MKARVEHRWDRDTVQVWLYDRQPDQSIRVYRILGEDAWQHEDVANGVTLPAPSFELRSEMLAALVEAAGDVLPPSGEMAEHLKDSREVRDRLLCMVEHKMGVDPK